MPIERSVRMTGQTISPRLAMRTLVNIERSRFGKCGGPRRDTKGGRSGRRVSVTGVPPVLAARKDRRFGYPDLIDFQSARTGGTPVTLTRRPDLPPSCPFVDQLLQSSVTIT